MNKTIIAVVVYVVAITYFTQVIKKQTHATNAPFTLTRLLAGAYVWLLLMSILDLFGGPLSDLASALSIVAAVYVTLNSVPTFEKLGQFFTRK